MPDARPAHRRVTIARVSWCDLMLNGRSFALFERQVQVGERMAVRRQSASGDELEVDVVVTDTEDWGAASGRTHRFAANFRLMDDGDRAAAGASRS